MTQYKLANRAKITLSVDDGRLVMQGPSGQHSVLVRYAVEGHDDLDRACVHLAGFLHTNGATHAEVSRILARFINDPSLAKLDIRDGTRIKATRIGVESVLRSLAMHGGRVVGVATSAGPGLPRSGYTRGCYVGQLVAWHVGVPAPVLM
ncbi:MAG: hypothetical protein RJA36_3088 [Pseudomonadota bacterium]|jgi:hypothetical protein